MTKTRHILVELSRAIARGERRTRKQWVYDLKTGYQFFCVVVNKHNEEYGLDQAIRPVRACKASGVVQTTRDGRWKNGRTVTCIRIPSPAIAAAGFDEFTEVAYRAEKGRIILEPVSWSGGREVPT